MKYKLHGTRVYNTETGSYIPNDLDNKDWQGYLVWVAEGNTAEPEFTALEADAIRKATIKKDAGDVIIALLPEWKQRNAIADCLALISDAVDLTVLTEEKQSAIQAYRTQWETIKNIRLKSDTAESNGLNPKDILW